MSPASVKPYVDLHLHTSCSDGSDPPREVVRRAAGLHFAAIAVTDHDTVAGTDEAAAASRDLGLEFLPGVEISAQCDRAEVHVVGLGIDPPQGPLMETLAALRNARIERASQIVERLHRLGVPAHLAEPPCLLIDDGAVGRMHIARQIVDAGFAVNVQQAFDKFLNPGRPAYVPKERVSCEKAIEVIHAAGGLAFIGPPGIGTLYEHLGRLTVLPFDGIEVYHTKHSPGQVDQFLQLARDLRWLVAGGSDCHGSAKTAPEMGKVRVPYEHYERIRDRLDAHSPRL